MNWITTDHVQSEIRFIEGFDVILFHEGEPINLDQDEFVDFHYDMWSRAAPRKMSIGDWISKRFNRKFPDLQVALLGRNGESLDLHISLEVVRSDTPFPFIRWPDTWVEHYKYKVDSKEVALRLKSDLIENGFRAKYLEEGLVFKDYYVLAESPRFRVLSHQYPSVIAEIERLAQKHTGIVFKPTLWDWTQYFEKGL
jgi:hypothetical protein